jgi:hypothetical protein
MKEVANNPNMLSVVLSVNNFLQGKGVETVERGMHGPIRKMP